MVEKRLLCPNRRRRTPAQFSWLDHRLVRERRLESCPVEAWALYLFLVTVGDAQGLSYYSDASLTARVPLDRHELLRARNALIDAGLIAFEPPLYQVLSLDDAPPTPTQRRSAPARRLSDEGCFLAPRPRRRQNIKEMLKNRHFLFHLRIRKRLGSNCASNARAFSDPLRASLSNPS